MSEEGESKVSVGEQDQVNLKIKCTNGSKFSVKTSLETTVGEFKGLLAQNCDVPAPQQRVIYKGRILKDGQTLASYGLQADHTVHMVRGSAPPPAIGGNSTTAHSGGPIPEDAGLGGVDATGFPGLGLGTLGGNAMYWLFGAGSPDFDVEQIQQYRQNPNMMREFGAGFPDFEVEQMRQQVIQDPNVMREIMKLPAFQILMNNPEVMRNLSILNPRLHEVIDRNPELAHVLNDPSIIQQTLEAMRNPELMREMMRNTARAMSNIESSSEGFRMLRRMHENIHETFFNATTVMGGGAASDVRSNPFAALSGNGNGAQSNDGSISSPAVPNANPLPNPWSNTGTNATGDGSLPPITSFAQIGHPEIDDMIMEDISDSSEFSELLQIPAIAQMMQSPSNPPDMNQILDQSPLLRSVFRMNPQLREILQNPDMLRMLLSPIEQSEALQQQLAAQLRQESDVERASAGLSAGTQNNMGLDVLTDRFGGLDAGSLTSSNTSNVPPEERYATQLSQLREMGFFDTQENIRALSATAGNVQAAVERLFGNPSQ